MKVRGAPRVVVTRPRARAASMIDRLEAAGCEVMHLPAIEVLPPTDPAPLRRAASDLSDVQWLVFTSVNGVRGFARVMGEVQGSVPADLRIAAVGPATAREVAERLGRDASLIPDGPRTAGGLLAAFERLDEDLAGRRILLPLAEAASDLLPSGLSQLGADVRRVVAYRTVLPPATDGERVRVAAAEGALDLLTFTSPSTAENLLEAVGDEVLPVPAAAIGPVTAAAARDLGFRVVVTPSEQSVDGLIEASLAYLGGREG